MRARSTLESMLSSGVCGLIVEPSKSALPNPNIALYQKIKEWARNEEYVSISRIQRECGMGFNRASRYFSLLQQDGIVSSEATKKGYKVIKNR